MRRPTLGFVLPLCALPLTASCVSPEELRHEDEATCAGYGFHVGTDAFAYLSPARKPGTPLLSSAANSILGLGLLARTLETVLAVTRGSEPTPSHPNIVGGQRQPTPRTARIESGPSTNAVAGFLSPGTAPRSLPVLYSDHSNDEQIEGEKR